MGTTNKVLCSDTANDTSNSSKIDYGQHILNMDLEFYEKIAILTLYYIQIMTYQNEELAKLYNHIGDKDFFTSLYTDKALLDKVHALYISKQYEKLGKLLSSLIISNALQLFLIKMPCTGAKN